MSSVGDAVVYLVAVDSGRVGNEGNVPVGMKRLVFLHWEHVKTNNIRVFTLNKTFRRCRHVTSGQHQ